MNDIEALRVSRQQTARRILRITEDRKYQGPSRLDHEYVIALEKLNFLDERIRQLSNAATSTPEDAGTTETDTH